MIHFREKCHTDGGTDRQTNRKTDRLTDRRMDGRTERQTENERFQGPSMGRGSKNETNIF